MTQEDRAVLDAVHL